MMLGLGQSTTIAGTTITTPTFIAGLEMWTSPSAALSTMGSIVSDPTDAFGGALLPFSLGVLLPPIALVAVVISMSGGKKR